MKDQRGFSLVELIIVIAIIAIIGSGVAGFLPVLNGKYAKEAATMTQSALAGSRMNALSKSAGAAEYDVYIRIYTDDGYVYIDSVVKGVTTTEKVGDRRVSVSGVKGMPGTTVHDQTVSLEDGAEIIIAFNRSDGSFNPIQGESGIYWKELYFTQGTHVYRLELVPRTGKFTLEKI